MADDDLLQYNIPGFACIVPKLTPYLPFLILEGRTQRSRGRRGRVTTRANNDCGQSSPNTGSIRAAAAPPPGTGRYSRTTQARDYSNGEEQHRLGIRLRLALPE